MLIEIPNVLSKAQVQQCRAAMDQAEWVDGNVTSGAQSALAKNNMQLLKARLWHARSGI